MEQDAACSLFPRVPPASAFELRSCLSHLLYNLIQIGIEITPARLKPADHRVPSGVALSSSEIIGNQALW